MGEIRRYRKKARFPIGAGAEPVSQGDISALTAEQRAISQLANVGGIFSAAMGRMIMRADEKAQTIAGEADMKGLMLALYDSFDTNSNEDEYKPAYEKTLKDIDGIIKNTKNKNSKIDLEQFKQKNIPLWENSLRDATYNRKGINALAARDKSIESIKGMDLSNPGEKLEAEGLIGRHGDVMSELGHSPEAIENWMVAALKDVDNQAIYQEAENISIEKGYQKAVDFVASQKIQVEDRDKILSNLASTERIRATRNQQARENTMRTMLSDIWDGIQKDPQAVTDAFRAGWLDDTDAKYLRDAIKNPDPPKTTNEALIAVRYAIDGIAAGTETRESALKKLISYTEQLSPTDGKAFIKEIFGEHDTKNAFWNRQAQEYMKAQIMKVASLTGILYGSGEQLALSAQALMSYDEAKKAAIADGKPLNGRELLELAHQTMLPFRNRVKPLISGEVIPETLVGGLVERTRLPEKTKEEKKAIIDSYQEPKTEADFSSTISHIPTKEMKIHYFETMIKRIKDEKLAEKLYKKWGDELYK